MSTDAPAPPEPPRRQFVNYKVLAAAVALLLLFGLILFGSVRGCLYEDPQTAAAREEERKKAEEERKKREEEEQKQDPEIGNPQVLPNDSPTLEQYVKPGHWVLASQRVTARNRQYVGQTRTAVVDSRRSVLPIDRTPYLLRASRPATLAKGQTKGIDAMFFVPPEIVAGGESFALSERARYFLQTEFEESGLGFIYARQAQLGVLPPHQYHLVVLAKEPNGYSYLKTLDSVHPPYSGESPQGESSMLGASERDAHYRVQQLDIARGIPLPDNPLLWTTIAYIVWDEVDLSPFTPGQEQALVDWLHWGGQLIVSGPDSLDLLKGSFLEPYLPAKGGEPWQISADDLTALNRNWMIGTPRRAGAPLAPAVPWSGVRLEPAAGAGAGASPPGARPTRGDIQRLSLFESTGGLLAERLVGRGRIVVTAMRLTERDLQNWSSGFESLFNGALLRRPPRVYQRVDEYGRSLLWDATADPTLTERRLDARLNTRLRYLARDLGVETHYRWDVVQPEQGAAGPFGQQFWAPGGQVPSERVYRAPASAGGLGAWSEFNATAEAARAALREAAGVEVPNSTFVLFCLAIYLAVLVPLNWMFFRSLGRVEWAWIAAPLIAVAGTFAVVHLAQLDIGFVRAQTEVGLLELQPDHVRGHLSRYTALYTSLSTTYNLEFEDATALALPFPARADYQMVRGQSYSTVDFRRQDRVRLAGLPVSSNSTGMVHSEQMFPLDGAVRLGRSTQGREQIENRSQFRLRSCAIVSKQAGELRGAWLGELMPGKSLAVSQVANLPQLAGDAPPFLAERAAENQLAVGERLNLEPMFQLALHKDHIEEGETRLVARLDELLPGEAVSPAASQLRTATLVVAHLEYGALPPPRPDKNTKLDVPIRQQIIND